MAEVQPTDHDQTESGQPGAPVGPVVDAALEGRNLTAIETGPGFEGYIDQATQVKIARYAYRDIRQSLFLNWVNIRHYVENVVPQTKQKLAEMEASSNPEHFARVPNYRAEINRLNYQVEGWLEEMNMRRLMLDSLVAQYGDEIRSIPVE